mmetsp:Transcript_105009/g.336108  ORF Transcript_105009/g.336108 Transcript_105009/m.336108 type:complete len:137 (+) Transcript_105009:336-746(+)
MRSSRPFCLLDDDEMSKISVKNLKRECIAELGEGIAQPTVDKQKMGMSMPSLHQSWGWSDDLHQRRRWRWVCSLAVWWSRMSTPRPRSLARARRPEARRWLRATKERRRPELSEVIESVEMRSAACNLQLAVCAAA